MVLSVRTQSLIIVLFTIFSCSKEEINKPSEDNYNEDLCEVIDNSNSAIRLKSSTTSPVRSTKRLDSDGDGISDYVEDRLQGYSKDVYDDYLSFPPQTLLRFATSIGPLDIPLYQTSFYQDNFLDVPPNSFIQNGNASDVLSDELIEYCKMTHRETVKLGRTPVMYELMKSKYTESGIFAKYIQQGKNVKRKYQMRRGSRTDGASNMWSYIAIASWRMDGGFKNGNNSGFTVTLWHELMHHISFSHKDGPPYGSEPGIPAARKAHGDYIVYDIEDSSLYDVKSKEELKNLVEAQIRANEKKYYFTDAEDIIQSNLDNIDIALSFTEQVDSIVANVKVQCIPIWAKNNNNYHSLHFLNIDGQELLARHWGSHYHFIDNQALVLGVGETYDITTQMLNGGLYKLWIDFNDDGDFSDDEMLINNARVGSRWKMQTHTITVPSDATPGKHLMRICKSTYHNPTACYFVKGQANDFSNVIIQ